MLAPSVSTMTTLSLPFSVLVRPSVKGSLLETTRQPQAVPSGTLVLPVGSMASMASRIACLARDRGHVLQRRDRAGRAGEVRTVAGTGIGRAVGLDAEIFAHVRLARGRRCVRPVRPPVVAVAEAVAVEVVSSSSWSRSRQRCLASSGANIGTNRVAGLLLSASCRCCCRAPDAPRRSPATWRTGWWCRYSPGGPVAFRHVPLLAYRVQMYSLRVRDFLAAGFRSHVRIEAEAGQRLVFADRPSRRRACTRRRRPSRQTGRRDGCRLSVCVIFDQSKFS